MLHWPSGAGGSAMVPGRNRICLPENVNGSDGASLPKRVIRDKTKIEVLLSYQWRCSMMLLLESDVPIITCSMMLLLEPDDPIITSWNQVF